MARNAASNPSDNAFNLLVACADWPRDERCKAAIRSAHDALDGDWDSFLQEVDRHQLSILAAEALRDAGVEPPIALRRTADSARMRGLMLSGEAVRAVQTLRSVGVEAVMLKGPLLSQMLYGDPTIRHSIDLDLLVAWEDFRGARDALEELGYALYGHEPPWDDWRLDHWRRMAKDVTLVDRRKGIALELHHRLKSPAELIPGLGPEQATDTVSLAGMRLRTFHPDDLFVYLCVHAATSLWDRLKWLADLRAILAGKPPLEIERLQARSAQLGTERCTALGLLLCQRIWGQPLPSSIETLVESDPQMARLIAASWQRLRGPERHHSSVANSLQRRHLVHLRKDGDYRRALSSEYLYDREILERFKLPRFLRGLYFLLRIGVFLQRKFGLLTESRKPGAATQSSIRQNRPA